MRALNDHDQDRLAAAIAGDGIIRHNDAVTALVMRARALGEQSLSLDILADRTQTAVARERAFGRVAATLAGGVRRRHRPAA